MNATAPSSSKPKRRGPAGLPIWLTSRERHLLDQALLLALLSIEGDYIPKSLTARNRAHWVKQEARLRALRERFNGHYTELLERLAPSHER